MERAFSRDALCFHFNSFLSQKKEAVRSSWIVSSNQSWLTVGTPSGFGNSSSIIVSATSNTGIQRTGTITVSYAGDSKQISVTQAAGVCTFDLPGFTSYNFGYSNETVFLDLSTNNTTDQWTVTKSDSWIVLSDATPPVNQSYLNGKGSKRIYYGVTGMTPHTGTRTGTITISSPCGGSLPPITVSQNSDRN